MQLHSIALCIWQHKNYQVHCFYKSFNEYKILVHEKDTLEDMTPGHKFGKNTYVKKFVSRFQCIFVENGYTNYCLHLRNVKLLSVGGQNGILVLHKN